MGFNPVEGPSDVKPAITLALDEAISLYTDMQQNLTVPSSAQGCGANAWRAPHNLKICTQPPIAESGNYDPRP
jgi:hypothetical protein